MIAGVPAGTSSTRGGGARRSFVAVDLDPQSGGEHGLPGPEPGEADLALVTRSAYEAGGRPFIRPGLLALVRLLRATACTCVAGCETSSRNYEMNELTVAGHRLPLLLSLGLRSCLKVLQSVPSFPRSAR